MVTLLVGIATMVALLGLMSWTLVEKATRSVVVSENKAKRSWNGRLLWLPVPLFTALRRLSSSDSNQT